MKLLKVSLSIDTIDAKFKVFEFEGEKKTKSYVLNSRTHVYSNGERKKEVVNKIVSFDKLMKPTTRQWDTHKSVRYGLWCLPEQLEEAKELLKNYITSIVHKVQEDYHKMVINFNTLKELD